MDEDFDRHGHPEDRLPQWSQRTQRAPPPSRYSPARSIIARPARAAPSSPYSYHADHQQQQQQQQPPQPPPQRSYQLEEYPVDAEGFDRHPQRRVSQEESYWQDHRQPERAVLRRDRLLHNSFSPVNRSTAPLDPHPWEDSAFVPSQYNNDRPRHSSPDAEDEWMTGQGNARPRPRSHAFQEEDRQYTITRDRSEEGAVAGGGRTASAHRRSPPPPSGEHFDVDHERQRRRDPRLAHRAESSGRQSHDDDDDDDDDDNNDDDDDEPGSISISKRHVRERSHGRSPTPVRRASPPSWLLQRQMEEEEEEQRRQQQRQQEEEEEEHEVEERQHRDHEQEELEEQQRRELEQQELEEQEQREREQRQQQKQEQQLLREQEEQERRDEEQQLLREKEQQQQQKQEQQLLREEEQQRREKEEQQQQHEQQEKERRQLQLQLEQQQHEQQEKERRQLQLQLEQQQHEQQEKERRQLQLQLEQQLQEQEQRQREQEQQEREKQRLEQQQREQLTAPPTLSVTLAPTTHFQPGGVSPRPKSSSAPTDPRKRRPRTSPRTSSGGGSKGKRAASSTSSPVSPRAATAVSKGEDLLVKDVALSATGTTDSATPSIDATADRATHSAAGTADSATHSVAASGSLPNLSGPTDAVSAPDGESFPVDDGAEDLLLAEHAAPERRECAEVVFVGSGGGGGGGSGGGDDGGGGDGGSGVGGHSGRNGGGGGGGEGSEPDSREVKRELMHAPRFVRRSSDDDEIEGRRGGSPRPDWRREQDNGWNGGVRHQRNDGGRDWRPDEERGGRQPPLAVSVQGVTLGGRGVQAVDDPGGVHVRLPLRGKSPAAHQDRRPRGPPPPPYSQPQPQERESQCWLPSRQGQPPPRGPRSVDGALPDHARGPGYAHDRSASPPRPPPGQQPWRNRKHSGDSFHSNGDSGGGGSGGEGFQNRAYMSGVDRAPRQATPPPDVGPQHLPNGGQRRSAYAQAMHNKRFMGSASRGAAAGDGARGFDGGGYRGGTGTFAPGLLPHPPMPPPPHDPGPQFPRRDYPPQPPHFQEGPPPGHWDNGFRDGLFAGSGGGGGSNGVGVEEDPSRMPMEGQAWGSFCEDMEDGEDFPLVHTSPEWTPALGRGGLVVLQRDQSPQTDRTKKKRRKGGRGGDSGDGGCSGGGGNDGGGGSGGGKGGSELTAEVVERRGPVPGKGKAKTAGKGGCDKATRESDEKPENGTSDEKPENGTSPPAEQTAPEIDPSPPAEETVQPAVKASVQDPEPVEGASVVASAVEAASAIEESTQPPDAGTAPAGSPAETARQRRLAPSPLAKAVWSIGDLASRFPKLAVPENLTHVIASWVALDTRAIGVVPMLCQPIDTAVGAMAEENLANGAGRKRGSQGKRKRVETETTRALDGGGGAAAAPAVPRGGDCQGRAWEARVLVPFGLVPEQAADGCWAEAMRLVLTPSTGDAFSPAKDRASDDEEEEEEGGGGDGVDATESAVEPPLTLPGGLWDPELDGGDPEIDDNRALISTAVRACNKSGGVDLAHCSSWLKFCEVHEEDRTTVVFLCGGGIRAAEGASGDLHIATISDMIRGRGVSSTAEGGSGGKRRGFEATFEAKLGAQFLWGLVSRDWAGVLLDCLRREAAAAEAAALTVLDAEAKGAPAAASSDKIDSGPGGGCSSVAREGKRGGKDKNASDGGAAASMVETPAEMRAALGLFDLEGEGWIAGDRLQAYLLDASFRLSARYIKSLLRGLCRVAGDGKRLLFEYRKRLAPEGPGAEGGVDADTAVEVEVAAGAEVGAGTEGAGDAATPPLLSLQTAAALEDDGSAANVGVSTEAEGVGDDAAATVEVSTEAEGVASAATAAANVGVSAESEGVVDSAAAGGSVEDTALGSPRRKLKKRK